MCPSGQKANMHDPGFSPIGFPNASEPTLLLLQAVLGLQLVVLLNVFRRGLVLGDAGVDEFLPLVALEFALLRDVSI
jgi:hypothetical protein